MRKFILIVAFGVVSWTGCVSIAQPDAMPGGKVIAFDYDGTCAVTPDLCIAFFRAVHDAGLTPILLTARMESLGGPVVEYAAQAERVLGFAIPVVFAGGRKKSEAAAFNGYQVAAICDDRSVDQPLAARGTLYVCGATVPGPAWYERLQQWW